MKGKKKHRLSSSWLVAITLTIIVVLICVINALCEKNPTFWEMSFSTGLSIVIGIWVSFMLVQRQTDIRKKKEALCELMKSIQDIVTNEDAYVIDDRITQQSLTMRTRDINNHLRILKKYGSEFGLGEDILFIEEKAHEYEQIIGDHITDRGYLAKSALELQRPLNLIEVRLFDMILKLYD